MFTMTEEQARAYVIAGFFPRRDDTAAITDLQDAYGHLPTQFVDDLLVDPQTAENAEKLYRMILPTDVVNYMISCAQSKKVNASDFLDTLRSNAFNKICDELRTIKSCKTAGDMEKAKTEARRVVNWAEILFDLRIIDGVEWESIVIKEIAFSPDELWS